MSKKSDWLTIWMRPRETIRRITSENPKRSLWFLALVYGFSSLLGSFQSISIGSSLSALSILILALIFAPIWGYIVFSVWSWIVLWAGKWLKGSGNFQTVRAAYAWSNVPIIVSDLVWLSMIVIFGSKIFGSPDMSGTQMPQGLAIFLLVLLLVKVVMSIWSLVIYLNMLAEVQGFSVLRAIGNVLIAAILVGIICTLLSLLVIAISGTSAQAPSAAAILNKVIG